MLETLIAIGAGIGGAMLGWAVRGNVGQPKAAQAAEAGTTAEPEETAEDEDLTQKGVYEIAERLRSLSMRIAANVDEHQSRVQQVNLALTEGDTCPEPDAVVDAVTLLIESNETMQAQLQEAERRIREQAAQLETAEERAVTDALTKIRNRRAFDDFLERCYDVRHHKPSTLMLLDVDHFKKFNDTYGHLAGDEVLRKVAGMLEAKLGEMGLVARYGGEEFAVVFEGQPLQDCRQVVEAARRSIGDREINFEGQRLRVTASLGLGQLDPEEALEEWVERVDQGLYQSKEAGRDCGYWMDRHEPKPLVEAETTAGTTFTERAGRPPADAASSTAEALPAENDMASVPSRSVKAVAVPPRRQGPAEERHEKKGSPDAEAAAGHPLQMLPDTAWREARQLHDADSLRSVFQEMRDRLRTVRLSLYVMIVRSDPDNASKSQRRLLLKSIRAVTRSLDQVGVLANGDFAILMPSVNEGTAVERAHAIRDSVEHCSQSDVAGPITVSIGLSLTHDGDSFEALVAASANAAVDAAGHGGGQLAFGGAAAAKGTDASAVVPAESR